MTHCEYFLQKTSNKPISWSLTVVKGIESCNKETVSLATDGLVFCHYSFKHITVNFSLIDCHSKTLLRGFKLFQKFTLYWRIEVPQPASGVSILFHFMGSIACEGKSCIGWVMLLDGSKHLWGHACAGCCNCSGGKMNKDSWRCSQFYSWLSHCF